MARATQGMFSAKRAGSLKCDSAPFLILSSVLGGVFTQWTTAMSSRECRKSTMATLGVRPVHYWHERGASALLARSVALVRQGVTWHGANFGRCFALHYITLRPVPILSTPSGGRRPRRRTPAPQHYPDLPTPHHPPPPPPTPPIQRWTTVTWQYAGSSSIPGHRIPRQCALSISSKIRQHLTFLLRITLTLTRSIPIQR